MINRAKIKACLHNICVHTVYVYFVYINTHTCIKYLRKICYVSIFYIFIYDIIYEYKYIHINTCTYFQNISCMCVSLYIHNKYTQYKHTNTGIM